MSSPSVAFECCCMGSFASERFWRKILLISAAFAGTTLGVIPASAQNSSATQNRTYTVAYVKSDRKWKYSFYSEKYDQISEHTRDALVSRLKEGGWEKAEYLKGDCCTVSIEVLEVTYHPAMVKKPGIDIAAMISVTDRTGHQRYAKGYRGESRTGFLNTYKNLIALAAESVATNAANDPDFVAALHGGVTTAN